MFTREFVRDTIKLAELQVVSQINYSYSTLYTTDSVDHPGRNC